MIEHSFFVWPAFAMTFLVLGLQLWIALKQARQIRSRLKNNYFALRQGRTRFSSNQPDHQT